MTPGSVSSHPMTPRQPPCGASMPRHCVRWSPQFGGPRRSRSSTSRSPGPSLAGAGSRHTPIGFDGFRWHTRAFCLTDQSFKDFLLSRIIETRGTKPSEAEPETDADWNEHVTLEIGPHPELSDTQQKVIALDYGMRSGKAKIPVRKALLYYALKRLGLDTDPAARRPQDQQIVLLNGARTRHQATSSDLRVPDGGLNDDREIAWHRRGHLGP